MLITRIRQITLFAFIFTFPHLYVCILWDFTTELGKMQESVAVVALFFCFAYCFAGKQKNRDYHDQKNEILFEKYL